MDLFEGFEPMTHPKYANDDKPSSKDNDDGIIYKHSLRLNSSSSQFFCSAVQRHTLEGQEDSYREEEEEKFNSGPTDDVDASAGGCLRRRPSVDKKPSGTFYKHNHMTLATHSRSSVDKGDDNLPSHICPHTKCPHTPEANKMKLDSS